MSQMSSGRRSSSRASPGLLVANHPRDFLPIAEHHKIQDALEGKPLPDVLPHTIEAGKDAYYIGDVYEARDGEKPWAIDTTNRPYLRHLKKVAKGWPHLRYLADWMEITTAPPKWKHVPKDNRDKRAALTKVCVIDFPEDNDKPPSRTNATTIEELRKVFSGTDDSHDTTCARLYVLEDLSRDMIEEFGSRYDVDPLFWRGHISDYLWYNTRDPWVELDSPPHIAQARNFYNLRYMHPRYFRDQDSHNRATLEAGRFNVLRRLDLDGSYIVILDAQDARIYLCRSKASLWIRPNKDGQKGTVGILVVDPTFKEGFPLWAGYRNFEPTPGLQAADADMEGPPRTSLFEDVIYWSMKLGSKDLAALQKQPRNLGIAALNVIAAEWLTVVQYLTTRLNQIEWELQHPDFRTPPYGLDASLRRLHPWRRSLPVYEMWVQEVLDDMLSDEALVKDEPHDRELLKLRADFIAVREALRAKQTQVQDMVSVVTAIISIEENKRSAEQNRNVTRLTYIAVLFAPMSFMCGFLSMTPDVTALSRTFWVYFVIAIPLTLVALGIAQWVYISGWAKARWKAYYGDTKQTGKK